MENIKKLYKVIMILKPDQKFESHLKFLPVVAIEEKLEDMLLNIRKKMIYKKDWSKEREELVLKVIKNKNKFIAYNKTNYCRFPQDYPIF